MSKGMEGLQQIEMRDISQRNLLFTKASLDEKCNMLFAGSYCNMLVELAQDTHILCSLDKEVEVWSMYVQYAALGERLAYGRIDRNKLVIRHMFGKVERARGVEFARIAFAELNDLFTKER